MKFQPQLYSDFREQLTKPYYIQYLVKCLLGSAICYALYLVFPEHQFQWSIISLLLVLAPEEKDSFRLSVDRMKANIIGALIGLTALLLYGMNITVLLVSVSATILFCTFIKLGNASRSALAALIIVLTDEEHRAGGMSAYERMFCVVAGCIIAMIITYIFIWINRRMQGRVDIN
ncbi:MAG TPA: FUSC family protein [Spirochaetota bacterium]|nr:FUSC family protein [Spirochaetota bacterium]HPJ34290.1 FUSC family protein [Spirochaetota bacterium]